MDRPLLPYRQTLHVTRDPERAASARRSREPTPGPTIVGLVGPGPGVGQNFGTGDSSAPPKQLHGGGRMVTLAPTLALFSASASCRGETISGYAETLRFPYWEEWRSTNDGTWGSPDSTSGRRIGPAITL